jgi:hypothetical protein
MTRKNITFKAEHRLINEEIIREEYIDHDHNDNICARKIATSRL